MTSSKHLKNMRILKTKPYAAIAGTLVVLIASQAVAQYDQVSPMRGSPMNGEVVATTPDAVTIKVAGTDRTVAVNEIKRVAFKEDPQELKTARTRAIAGDFQSALDTLKRANLGSIQRPIVQQDFQFYAAYCMGKLALTRGGDKKQAVDLMLKFIRANPNNHHYYQAAELLGDLALALGSLENAVKYYGVISSKAPWPDYKMRGALLEARAMSAQGDHPEAQAKFQAIASAGGATPEIRRMQLLAEVDVARTQAHTGSPAESITALEDLIAKNDDTDQELFGRAYNALGMCYRLQSKPKDALMAYLHVDVLFFGDSEVHAEALHWLAKLWDQVKNPDRAVAARNMLSDRYAGSMWATAE